MREEPLQSPFMNTVDIHDILKLSVAERIQLVGDIWDSIAASPAALPVSAGQKRELDRRLAQYWKDPSAGRSWEEIRDSLDHEE